jgi:hypothetical protein
MRNNASLWLLSGIGLLTFVSPALAGITTPEPSSGLLIAGGLGALILLYRHKRSKK